MRALILLLFTTLTLAARAQSRCEDVFAAPAPANPYALPAGFDEEASWGEQVVANYLGIASHITSRLASLPADQKINYALTGGLRQIFFRLESVAKFYSGTDEFFLPYHAAFKQIEDVAGQVDLYNGLSARAAAINENDLAAAFDQQKAANAAKLFGLLGMMDLPKITAELSAYRGWPRGAADRQFLEDGLLRFIKKLRAQVDDYAFDQADIEDGFHKLRRQLRWIGFQLECMDGLIAHVDEGALAPDLQVWFNELASRNPGLLNEAGFFRAGPAVVAHPLRIPRRSLAMIVQLVADIGASKDEAEPQIDFDREMRALGYGKARRRAVMAKLNAALGTQTIDHEKLAHDYQKRMRKTDLLGAFRDGLKALN